MDFYDKDVDCVSNKQYPFAAGQEKTEGHLKSQNNAENFRLSDFISLDGANIKERADFFKEIVSQYVENEDSIWARPLRTACQSSVEIEQDDGHYHTEVMMGSNNYLGLANDPYVIERVIGLIRQFGTGSGGPPLLSGTLAIHKTLEKKLALLKNADDAMLFASGYQANLGWVEACLRKGDILIYDEQSHASLFDGMASSRVWHKFSTKRFKHNDLTHLERRLEISQKSIIEKGAGSIYVTCEGVYSMKGDLAPLPEILELCEKYQAYLVIDDAHGTGVMGARGCGTLEHYGLVDHHPSLLLNVGTFSKAFGTVGGFIAGDENIINYLRFYARSYLFSAHIPPPIVAAVIAGIEKMQMEPERLSRLHKNVRYLVDGFKNIGISVSTPSAILAVPIQEHISIRKLTSRFHDEGVFLNCIEYPAVSIENQMLRISVMATHSQKELDIVISAMEKLGNEFGFLN